MGASQGWVAELVATAKPLTRALAMSLLLFGTTQRDLFLRNINSSSPLEGASKTFGCDPVRGDAVEVADSGGRLV